MIRGYKGIVLSLCHSHRGHLINLQYMCGMRNNNGAISTEHAYRAHDLYSSSVLAGRR